MTNKQNKIWQIIFEAILVLVYTYLAYFICVKNFSSGSFFGTSACIFRQAFYFFVPVAFILTSLFAKRFYDKEEQRLVAFKGIKNKLFSNFLVYSFVIWVEILIIAHLFVYLFGYIKKIVVSKIGFCGLEMAGRVDFSGFSAIFKALSREDGYSFCRCLNVIPVDYLILAGLILVARIVFILVKKVNNL